MKAGKGSAVVRGVIIGIIVCIVISVTATAIMAWMIAKMYISEKYIGYVSLGIMAVSVILGTVASILKAKEKTLIVSLVTAAGYIAFLLSCTAIFFQGEYEGVGVTVILICGSSISVALGSTRWRSGSKKIRSKRRFR